MEQFIGNLTKLRIKIISGGTLFVVSAACAGSAQSVGPTQRGHIYDTSGKPISLATVTGGDKSTTSVLTDNNGFFRLQFRPQVKEGELVWIHIQKDGYRPGDYQVGVSSESDTAFNLISVNVSREAKPKSPPTAQTPMKEVSPVNTVNSAPNGISVSGGTVISPVINNNSGSAIVPPKVFWKNLGNHPINGKSTQGIEIRVDRTIDFPAFSVTCDAPCHVIDAVAETNSRVDTILKQGDLVSGFIMAAPRPLQEGIAITAAVVSDGAKQAHVLSVAVIKVNELYGSP